MQKGRCNGSNYVRWNSYDGRPKAEAGIVPAVHAWNAVIASGRWDAGVRAEGVVRKQ